MSIAQKDLTALLGSRICHDLISPLGAISNGVELLQMAGADTSPEMELISESVNNANARIRFFRVAFGAASEGQLIGQSEIKGILDDLTRGTRLKIDWQVAGDQVRQDIKLVFLLLQCLENAMPWGGQITVSKDGANWSVSGTSDRTKIDNDLWNVLTSEATDRDVSASEVQFLLLPILMAAAGRTLTTDLSETGVVARF